MKNKRGDKKSRIYSLTVKTSTTATTTPIDKESHLKIFTRIMHAHIMNVREPGAYATEPEILQLNNLPCISAPHNPPLQKIFTEITHIEQEQRQEEENLEEEEMEEQETEKEDKGRKEENQPKQICKVKTWVLWFTPQDPQDGQKKHWQKMD